MSIPRLSLTKRLYELLPLFLLLLVAAFLRIWLSSGVEGSDDVVYLNEAYKIFSGIYEVPTYVANLRIGTILPIALMFKLFGVNSYTIFMWPLIASLINIVVIYLISFKLFGRRTALFATLCAAFFPLDIHMGGRAMTEASLTLMLSISVLFYLLGYREEVQRKRAFFCVMSGLFVGLAYLNKHPAILIFFFFLTHSILARNSLLHLIYMLTGSFVVFVFENIYFGLITGDPLFMVQKVLTVFGLSDGIRRISFPNTSLTYYLYYTLVSLQHVGLYFYLSMAGLAHSFFSKSHIEPNHASGVRFLMTWGLSMVFIMTFLPTNLNPLSFIPKQTNYMMMFCVPFIILSGYSLSLIRRKQLMYAAVVILCSTSIFCAYFQKNTIKSHSHNTEAAFEHIAKHPDSVLITGEFNTHYCIIYNILQKQKIEYRFFDEIINGRIDKALYKYQKKSGDDQQLMDDIRTYDKVLVLYDLRMAERQKGRYYYPDLNIFQDPESNFKLIATIKKENNKLEQMLKPVLTNLVRIIENYGLGNNFAQKIKGQMKDVFDPDPAYLFMKEQRQ